MHGTLKIFRNLEVGIVSIFSDEETEAEKLNNLLEVTRLVSSKNEIKNLGLFNPKFMFSANAIQTGPFRGLHANYSIIKTKPYLFNPNGTLIPYFSKELYREDQ